MATVSPPPARRGLPALAAVLLAAVPVTAAVLALGGGPSAAAATSVDLGVAESFSVLAGQSVTNTGPSVLSGDLGVSPGTAVTGFPPGQVLGTTHAGDPVADQAQSDLTTAYNEVAGQPSDEAITDDLAGRTLTTGVYTASEEMGLTGELTLDAQGDPTAVFVFQAGSTLITASGSQVTLVNGAQACNVFWQVGSSATLGSDSTMVGTILALTSITATTGATIEGRLLARNGSVTLDDNIIDDPSCATGLPSTGGPSSSVPGSSGPSSSGPSSSGPGADGPASDGSAPPTAGDGSSDGDDGAGGPGDGSGQQVAGPPSGFPATGDGGSVAGRSTLVAGGGLLLVLAATLALHWRRGHARA